MQAQVGKKYRLRYARQETPFIVKEVSKLGVVVYKENDPSYRRKIPHASFNNWYEEVKK